MYRDTFRALKLARNLSLPIETAGRWRWRFGPWQWLMTASDGLTGYPDRLPPPAGHHKDWERIKRLHAVAASQQAFASVFNGNVADPGRTVVAEEIRWITHKFPCWDRAEGGCHSVRPYRSRGDVLLRFLAAPCGVVLSRLI